MKRKTCVELMNFNPELLPNKPARRTRAPAPDLEEKTKSYKPLEDVLGKSLLVLFIGINPGLRSSEVGHHFAGHTNHFWPCLSESGLVNKKLTYADDKSLAKDYRLGLTNLAGRPTRNAAGLTIDEQKMGIPGALAKIRASKPLIVCFVGKGNYELFSGKRKCELGEQEDRIFWDSTDGKGDVFEFEGEEDPLEKTRRNKGYSSVFVMPSTSGLVSHYQKKDKVLFFQALKRFLDKQLQAEEHDKT
eukprot:TRINITY_DN8779_c0_g1_i1.p1 TRINITY_DN8779_c0_g1~~TRINITY_DN8779_c0_g1_i1.p1  ORF type:complete len:253 (+),score=26.08 TRINITY_DN8779_c0_g1_i1:24-761(+)